MEEIYAIILVVIGCCGVFFAWLISMAMCPDGLIRVLGGASVRKIKSGSSSARESRELIRKSDDTVNGDAENGMCDTEDILVPPPAEMARSVSAILSAARGRNDDKKLSVVDEVDEQNTLQSTIHSGCRPSILKHPMTQVVAECHPEPKVEEEEEE